MEFERLLKAISPRIRLIARKMNRHFGFFDEDDLFQEALLYLWEKFKKGELYGKNNGYLIQGCIFFLKNYIRVACKTVDLNSISISAVINEETESTIEDTICAEDPSGRFAFIVVEVAIEDILKCLNIREKRVFLLSLEEMTTREIGGKLGLSHVMVVKLKKKIHEKCESVIREIKTPKG